MGGLLQSWVRILPGKWEHWLEFCVQFFKDWKQYACLWRQYSSSASEIPSYLQYEPWNIPRELPTFQAILEAIFQDPLGPLEAIFEARPPPLEAIFEARPRPLEGTFGARFPRLEVLFIPGPCNIGRKVLRLPRILDGFVRKVRRTFEAKCHGV